MERNPATHGAVRWESMGKWIEIHSTFQLWSERKCSTCTHFQWDPFIIYLLSEEADMLFQLVNHLSLCEYRELIFFFFSCVCRGGHVAQQLAYIFLPGWTDKLNSFLGMLMLTIQSVVCACNVRLCTCSACLSTKQGAMGWIKIQQKYSIISFSPLYLFVSFMSSTICSI